MLIIYKSIFPQIFIDTRTKGSTVIMCQKSVLWVFKLVEIKIHPLMESPQSCSIVDRPIHVFLNPYELSLFLNQQHILWYDDRHRGMDEEPWHKSSLMFTIGLHIEAAALINTFTPSPQLSR